MFRRAILDRIDEELRSAPARARLVELGDPLARGVQIVRPWRDHQQRVEALERDDAQHACHRTGQLDGAAAVRTGRGRRARSALPRRQRLRASISDRTRPGQHRLQPRIHLLHGSVLERKEPDGHALEDVDIESVDDFHPPRDLRLRTGKDEQVAEGIDTDEGLRSGDGLENVGHFRHADVAERDDDHVVPGRQLAYAAEGRRHPTHVRGRADVIDAARILDHHEPVCLQHGLEDRKHLVQRKRRLRLQRDGAADPIVDGVGDLENVSEHCVHHVRNRCLLELELNRGACCAKTGIGLWRRKHPVVAADYGGLVRRFGAVSGAVLRAIALGRLQGGAHRAGRRLCGHDSRVGHLRRRGTCGKREDQCGKQGA